MSQPTEPPAEPGPQGRLESLDAFRGLTLAGMILVNNAGDGAHAYPPLRHAEWHGWTPTDLVFPSFLFIVGVAIPLALGKRIARGDSTGAIFAKVIRRSVIIFALGLLLNWFPFQKSIADLRIPGVLQRIALCYFAASFIFLETRVRTQVALTAVILVGYWAILQLPAPVAGVGSGDLSRPNSLPSWVDRTLLRGHTYKPDYDPEGILSTLPAVASTLIGVLAGVWLSGRRPAGDRVAGLFVAGALCLVAGSVWGLYFPINKALWTSPFVLWSAGLSLQILGICAFLIDLMGVRRWAWPFLVFGANPIAAYVLSGLFGGVLRMVTVHGASGATVNLRTWLYRNGFSAWFEPSLASFLWALAYVLFWLAIMSIFYRFKWFIRV